ncbi:MAG: hypothetical protein M1830_008995 [Pleopsidium flavum]|nr:MAG: hypothetical protein M1830_008995 [Pleopsidium flavum]
MGAEASTSLRRKWAARVKYSIEQLHDCRIVWGDAKADNVMIDSENEAWMIDFGGGFTHGWVDEEKRETVEGDLQALSKIFTTLGLNQDSIS